MIFTQEQINEIKQRLALAGSKDPSLPLADLPLSGEETIALVQQGENRRVPIEEFYEEFAQYIDGSERVDFFNVSRYAQRIAGSDESAPLTLNEAVALCPPDVRRGGQVITFVNREGDWMLWQYKGTDASQWEDTSMMWMNLESDPNLGVIFTVSDSSIPVGETKSIYLHFETSDGGEASIVQLLVNDEVYKTYKDIVTFNLNIDVDAETEFTVKAYQYGYEYIESHKVLVSYPAWIGAGENYDDVVAEPYKIQVTDTMDGTYDVVFNYLAYLIILVPKHLTLGPIKMSGFDVPMQATYTQKIDGIDYTVYMSGNKYVAGTHTFVVGTYQGTEHELVTSMQQDIAGLQTLVGEQEQINQEQAGDIDNLQEDVHNLQEEGLNGPDNEDIVLLDKKYKFANKEHDNLNFSGMGRVYLRKNVQSITEITGNVTTTTQRNLLTQDMISKPNTIYHIQYDYELAKVASVRMAEDKSMTINDVQFFYQEVTVKKGETIVITSGNGKLILFHGYEWKVSNDNHYTNESSADEVIRVGVPFYTTAPIGYTILGATITIPENCILKFDGGSLSNGTLNGNSTTINSDIVTILTNINVTGNWNINDVYPEWFKNNSDDDYSNAIDLCYGFNSNNIVFTSGIYEISRTIHFEKTNIIISKNAVVKAINDIDCVFLYDGTDVPTDVKYQPCIYGHGIIDANKKANYCVAFRYGRRAYAKELVLKNAINAGIICGYENTKGSINIRDFIISNCEVGIICNTADSTIDHVTIIDCVIGLECSAGNIKVYNIHHWLSDPTLWENSVTIIHKNTNSGNFINCEADTVRTFYKEYSEFSYVTIINPIQYKNDNIVSDELATTYSPTLIDKSNIVEGTRGKGTLLNIIGGTCRFTVPFNIVTEDSRFDTIIISTTRENFIVGEYNKLSQKIPVDIVRQSSELYNLTDKQIGVQSIYNLIRSSDYKNIPIWWNGEAWVKADGSLYYEAKYGSTTARPASGSIPKGYCYFDTSLNKPIWFDGTRWRDNKGYTAGITRGTSDKRPQGEAAGGILNIYDVGYQYYDTTLSKPIFAKSIGQNTGTVIWIDATGAEV